MIISGTNIRTFYPQQLVNWGTQFSQSNTSGSLDVYFSGINGNSNIFSLNNGKIYSPNNLLIGGYSSDSNISLSGNFSSKTCDLYNNNIPLYLGLSRQNTGIFSGIVFKTNGCYTDLSNITLYGNSVNFTYSQNLTFKSGTTLPISIYNPGSYPFKIISGTSSTEDFILSGVTGLIIPPNTSNSFYIISTNPEDTVTNKNFYIDLDTEIGEKMLNISISGYQIIVGTNSLQFGPTNYFVSNNLTNTYLLSYQSASGLNLSIGLDYISGYTGLYYSNYITTGLATGVKLTGNIYGYGYLTSSDIITGIISSYNIYTSSYEYATGSTIGSIIEAKISDDKVVTGYYSDILSNGFGYIKYTGNFDCTGFATGIQYSGYVYADQSINIIGYVATGRVTGTNYGQTLTGLMQTGGYSLYFYDNTAPGATDGMKYFTGSGLFFSTITGIKVNVSGLQGTYSMSGIITGKSTAGIYAYNGNVTGTWLGDTGNYPTFNGQFPYDNFPYLTNIQLYPTTPFTGNLRTEILSTGYYESNSGSAVLTGLFSGFRGNRTYKNVWNISTGTTTDSIISYKDNNYFSGINYYNKVTDGSSDVYDQNIFISINYNNYLDTFSDIDDDFVNLKITGYNFSGIDSGINFILKGNK
jgi:hypothetical protein